MTNPSDEAMKRARQIAAKHIAWVLTPDNGEGVATAIALAIDKAVEEAEAKRTEAEKTAWFNFNVQQHVYGYLLERGVAVAEQHDGDDLGAAKNIIASIEALEASAIRTRKQEDDR